MPRVLSSVTTILILPLLGACQEPAGPSGDPATLVLQVDSISISPGQSAQLFASVHDSLGSELRGAPVTWRSADTARVRVSASGWVTGVRVARVTVYAQVVTASGYPLFDQALVKVVGTLAHIHVDAPVYETLPGDTVRATALPYDSAGNPLPAIPVAWSSSDPTRAEVSDDGLITVKWPGDVVISASALGKTGNLDLRVLVPVASIAVVPSTAGLVPSGTLPLIAVLRDSADGVVLGRVPTWSTSDANVAQVAPDGIITAIAAGSALVVARREGYADTTVVTVSRVTITTLSGGGEHNCGLTPTGAAWCWGSNSRGQLGVGPTQPLSTAPVATVGAHMFASISSGADHTCAVTASGAAYCWGYGRDGALGDGGDTSSSTPTPVAGDLTFEAITAGGSFTCGLTVDSLAYCWGYNRRGQLGTGDSVSRSMPTAVAGDLKFVTLSAGRGGDFFAVHHTCGLAADSVAYCWGFNGYGELGDGGYVSRAVPAPVYGGWRFRMVAAGGDFSCGVTTASAALCWGAGGALGDGSSDGNPAPVVVSGGGTFASVSAGRHHTCGVTPSAEARCWGSYGGGWVSTPTIVSGGYTWSMVSAGPDHTCGITGDGVAYCWALTPTRVVGQP